MNRGGENHESQPQGPNAIIQLYGSNGKVIADPKRKRTEEGVIPKYVDQMDTSIGPNTKKSDLNIVEFEMPRNEVWASSVDEARLNK